MGLVNLDSFCMRVLFVCLLGVPLLVKAYHGIILHPRITYVIPVFYPCRRFALQFPIDGT